MYKMLNEMGDLIEDLRAILLHFDLGENLTDISEGRELTDGHINSTYVLEAHRGVGQSAQGELCRFVLQKINTYVFKRPEELMENFVRVTRYIRQQGHSALEVHPARDGKWYHVDAAGSHWRCYTYVDNAYSLQAAGSEQEAFCAAKAFGAFQRMLGGFPIETLHETIPDFHNTAKRYEALEQAVLNNRAGRKHEVEAEIAFARARKADASRLLDLLKAGKLPLRVTHNDTKLNNVLFDKDTHEPVCVVDLDTIMPGLSLYDYGDSLRFLGSTAAEDERDISKVHFSMPLFKAYTRGYLEAAASALTETEIAMLPFSIKLMTYECGMRFLTDYLEGDVYFRIRQPDDNLIRCRTQFALVKEIEWLMTEMEGYIKEIV